MQSDDNPLTADTGPGAGIKDLLPIPATDPTEFQGQEPSNRPGDGPTFSHALAADSQHHDGLAQQGHEGQELDLGWNEKKEDIAAPLVGGMDNEELWMLVRRFNKQIYDVKATPYPPPGGLDLNMADDEEFTPDKMRANIERLYMTVGVGMLGAFKHVVRLRSWRETRRTGCFAAAYFTAWLFNFLTPLLSAVLIALIGFPVSRDYLFPPAPIALVNSETGGVQKPRAGVLGSHDSATGAPENHKGEAVEQEASNFVTNIASLALSSASGKHPAGDPDADGNGAADAAPDPTALATSAADAKYKVNGGRTGTKHDKTKVPMETAMWIKMRPIMHTISTVSDTWERLANALSPIPLFPSDVYRMRLVAILLPLAFGASLFLTPYLFVKSSSFLAGFLFFGDPILSRGMAWLNRTIPNWQKLLELRNTLLKGVPTNAQLTLTLLRHAEANHAPLPPPPRITSPPPSRPASLSDANLRATGAEPPLNATQAELDAAILPDSALPPWQRTGERDEDLAKTTKMHPHKGGKILGLVKGAARGLVRTAVGGDSVRAKLPGGGGGEAKNRLGVIPPRDEVATSGPVEFEARWEGKKGRVLLSGSGASVPVVAFVEGERSGTVEIAGEERVDLKAVWTVAVGDVVELRKIGGYGWKAKLVVGWSMEREIKDGLVIRTASGEEYKVTALPMRDELFNRLVAIGGQKWVAY